MDISIVKELGVSLGLGLLVGFQREWGPPHVAGIRSFAFITILGTVCARLSAEYGSGIVSAGMIGLTAMLIAGGVSKYFSENSIMRKPRPPNPPI